VGDYAFRPYDPSLRDQVIGLQRLAFGGSTASNDAYFHWKYEQNPYVAEPVFTLALEGERLVGMRGFYGARWSAGPGATPVDVPVGAETAVHPDHRGRWLVDRIMRVALPDLAARGYPYAFNLSGNPAVRAISLRAGWKPAAPFATWRRARPPRGLRAAYLRLRRQARRALRIPAGDLTTLHERRDLTGVTITNNPDPEAMAQLVERTRDGRLGHVRDAAFYRWRLRDPRAIFRTLELREAGRLGAFLALAQRGSRGNVIILDWAAEDPARLAPLLDLVVAAPLRAIAIWSTTVPPDVRALLAERGFAPAEEPAPPGREPALLAVPTAPTDDPTWSLCDHPLLDQTCWDLRMSCSDAY
jgi:GNAT superfamily N-acetyltransferase